MRVELLPSCVGPSRVGPSCVGPTGSGATPSGSASAQFLVSYLVNDEIVIDAGAIGLLADLDRQRRVRHVLLTHEHLDHLASLPILLENVYDPGPDCIELLASSRVLDVVRRDLFNGRIWPDFFELSTPVDAFVRAATLVEGQSIERAGLTILPLAVDHCVDTLGFVVDDGHAAVAFPSDTGPTESFWQHLAALPRLDAVFLEVSFPNSQADLAHRTCHHCPATFAAEVGKLSRPVRWIVVHRKARYADEIARELAALDLPGVELVEPGQGYVFGEPKTQRD